MKLTPEQEKAITLPKSMAVIASAGTGKTTVLTQRFLYAITNRHIPVSGLLAFTFTEKASGEMKERIMRSETLSLLDRAHLNVSTIHSFCHKLLSKHGAVFGLEEGFNIASDEALKIWHNLETRLWIASELENPESSLTQFCEQYGTKNLSKTIRHLIGEDLTQVSVEQLTAQGRNQQEHALLTQFLQKNQEFQEYLLQRRIQSQVLSYNDLETLCLRLFVQHPDILKSLQNRYREILVDEFQDVSQQQMQIIHSLFTAEHNTLFIVGDPKQSIYGFRGGNTRYFFETSELIQNAGGEEVYLSQTFRTPKGLTNYFNAVFPNLLGDKLYHQALSEQDTAFCLSAKLLDKKADSEHSATEQMVSDCVSKIKKLVDNGAAPADIAILLRARTALSEFEKRLETLGIATLHEAKFPYTDIPTISLYWHILRILCKDASRIVQLGLLRLEPFRFSENFISHINKTNEENIFLNQTLDLFASQKEAKLWDQLTQFLKKWHQATSDLLPTQIFDLISEDLRHFSDQIDLKALGILRPIIKTWQDQGNKDLAALSHFLNDLNNPDFTFKKAKDSPNAVSLITVHGSKGLEFDHVFVIPGKSSPKDKAIFLRSNNNFTFKAPDEKSIDGLDYPLIHSEASAKSEEQNKQFELEEEKRLLYVALTRTKKSLHLYTDNLTGTLAKKLKSETQDFSNYNEWLYWLATKAKEQPSPEFSSLITGQQRLGLEDPNQHEPTDFTPITAQQELLSRLPLQHHAPTAIETFVQCPKKYHLKHVLGIRGSFGFATNKKGATLSAAERGNLIHLVMQNAVFDESFNLKEAIEQAAFALKITASTETLADELSGLLHKLKDSPRFDEIFIEPDFSFEEMPFVLQLGTRVISGQIDKVLHKKSETNEEWTILDYKTHNIRSEAQRSRLLDEFYFQISTYALALAKAKGLDRVKTMILFTSDMTTSEVIHDANSLQAFESELQNTLEQLGTCLINNDFPVTSNEKHCEGCVYYEENYCDVMSKRHPNSS
ncbi:MAG: ATP-dependent helicase [Deltaproteobacteria bacterium]|nr:ATP-dependent helicase [Deltaproteobacteria bacterium]